MSFTPLYNTKAKGAITFTGNALGLCQDTDQNEPGVLGSSGAFTTLDTSLQVGSYPPGTTLNYTLNSSSAQLVLPPGSTVLHAQLTWGGNYAYDYTDSGPPPVTAQGSIQSVLNNPVLFTPPGALSPIPISPDSGQEHNFPVTLGTVSVTSSWYMRTADVTQYVQNPGTYITGSVPGLVVPQTLYTAGTNNAGWALSVVYENPSLPERGLYLWTGAELIHELNPSKDIPIGGFETLPAGPVNARLLLSAQEGDASNPGDQVLFGPTSGTVVPISGPNNPVTNFFGAQINDDSGNLDTTGVKGGPNSNPFLVSNALGGRTGLDVTNIDVSAEMANSQTNAVIRLFTDFDAYMVNAIGFQTDVLSLDVEAVKTVDKNYADLGETITYTTVVTNNSNVPITGVTFTDAIPSGTSFVLNSVYVDLVQQIGANPAAGVPLPNLAIGDSTKVSFQVTVNNVLPPAQNPIPNTGIVSFNYGGIEPGSSTSTTVQTQINNATLTAVKTVDKAYAQPGDILTYSTVISNIGTTTAQNIVFTDAIPVGTTFVPNSLIVGGNQIIGGNPASGVPVPNITAGGNVLVTFKVKVGNTIPSINPVINNNTTAYKYVVTPGTAAKTAIPTLSTNAQTQVNIAILDIQKSPDSSYKDLGDTVVYTIVVKNEGNVTAGGVVITDILQSGNTFVPGSVTIDTNPSLDSPLTGIFLGDIAAGNTATITFEAIVDSIPATNPIPNTAVGKYTYIVDPQQLPVPGENQSNTTTVNVVHGEILPQNLIKSANKIVTTQGDIITYKVTAKNTGNTPINLVINDVLPIGVSFNPGTVVINGVNKPTQDPNLGINVGVVNPGDTVVVLFKVTVLGNEPTVLVNTATANYSYTVDPAQPPVNKETVSNEVDIPNLTANIDIVKSSNVDVTAIGETVTYILDVTNTGNIDLISVVVNDLLSPNVDFVNGSVEVDGLPYPSADILAGVDIGPLLIGQTKQVTFDAKVIGAVGGEIKNISTVTYTYKLTPQDQERIKTEQSNENTIIVESPKLQITKVADKTSVILGDIITYKVVLFNSGDTDLLNVFFYDTLPENLVLVPNSITVNGIGVNLDTLEDGIDIGEILQGKKVTIQYSVKVISGSCSGYSENRAYAVYNYVLENGVTGEGITEIASVKIDVAINTFKQIAIDKSFTIPCAKPSIEEVDELKVNISIADSYVIKTPVSTSDEGQVLSGYKLIIHGYVDASLEYTALVKDQAIHSAHWRVPFSEFLVLPADYKIGQTVEVSSIVEEVDVDMLDERTVSANVMLLLVGKTK